MIQKLTIKNINKLKGRLAHKDWEVSDINVGHDYYKFHLVNPGQFKHITWMITLDRGMWGEGYRMFIRGTNPTRDIEIYFDKSDMATPGALCNRMEELINMTETK